MILEYFWIFVALGACIFLLVVYVMNTSIWKEFLMRPKTIFFLKRKLCTGTLREKSIAGKILFDLYKKGVLNEGYLYILLEAYKDIAFMNQFVKEIILILKKVGLSNQDKTRIQCMYSNLQSTHKRYLKKLLYSC